MKIHRKAAETAILFAVCFAVTAAGLISGALFVFPGLFTGESGEADLPIGDRTAAKPVPDAGDGEAEDSLLAKMLSDGTEIAGVYVATVGNLNYPERQGMSDGELKSGLDGIVSVCKSAGLNTIVFQVRPMSDAFYRSTVFPSSEYITGKQGQAPGIDVLAELITRAHAEGIAVVAWVNPLRAARGGPGGLSPANPAVMHPEYTVSYGGIVWYDPGLPEVRRLVARGCAEIAANYEVDGILFDDYFYPYPKDGEVFDDSGSYAEYGKGAPLGDWRRENINSLVRESFEAVKAANAGCPFGIAPFGIWSNDDGKNGGSATRGLDAYNEIYCDALAWAAGGYVDFLAPQIYWSFDHPSAPYAEVARWWAEKLKGSDVALLSSNAAYRIGEWSDPDELIKQIEYDRLTGGYSGCIFYSYEAFVSDKSGIVSQTAAAFSQKDSPSAK